MQPQGCTKQLFKVTVAWPVARARRLPGVTPSALETHAFPTPALQNQQLTLRKAGSFVLSSTSGQPRGKVLVADRSGSNFAEPCQGPIQAYEVGSYGA